MSLLARLYGRLPAWAAPIFYVWFGTRVAILIAAWVAAQLSEHGWMKHRSGSQYGIGSVLGSWDAKWYLTISQNGYPTEIRGQSPLGFFPFVAMVMRFAREIGLPPMAFAVLAANIAALLALWAVAALTEELFDLAIATRTGIYIALSPGGAALALAYTEAFALALGVAAVVMLRRGHLVPAAILGLLVGTTRGQGFLFALPMLGAVLARPPGWRARLPALLVAGTPVIGMLGYFTYLYVHTGDFLAYSDAQRRGWARTSPGFEGLQRAYSNARYHLDPEHIEPWYLRDVVVTVFYLAMLVIAAIRRMPWEWVLFGFAIILLPLAAGSVAGIARYGMLALPVFWVVAQAGRWGIVDATWRYAGLAIIVANVMWLPIRWP